MRTAYHEQLDDLAARLGETCGLAGAAMKRATQALLETDVAAAEEVISDHGHPGQVLPEDVRRCFAEMGKVAIALGDSAKQALLSRDPQQAAQLHEQDKAMDELYQHLFGVLLDREWQHGASVGVQAALLGRFYERFADHAVEIGRRVIFWPGRPFTATVIGLPSVSTALIPARPDWIPRSIWSATDGPRFDTVCGQLQLRSLNTLGSAPAGAANPRAAPRTTAPLKNIFVVTHSSL